MRLITRYTINCEWHGRVVSAESHSPGGRGCGCARIRSWRPAGSHDGAGAGRLRPLAYLGFLDGAQLPLAGNPLEGVLAAVGEAAAAIAALFTRSSPGSGQWSARMMRKAAAAARCCADSR